MNNNDLWERARKLAAINYSIEVLKDETSTGETVYLAKNPQLYGCMAQGTSPEEAMESLEEARIDYIHSLLEDGLDVPNPEETLTGASKPTFTSTINYFEVMSDEAYKKLREQGVSPTHEESLYEVSVKT